MTTLEWTLVATAAVILLMPHLVRLVCRGGAAFVLLPALPVAMWAAVSPTPRAEVLAWLHTAAATPDPRGVAWGAAIAVAVDVAVLALARPHHRRAYR
ncbi:MAG: hypothetical protein JWM48_1966 [Mycobacterium sp.]|nr:hypothetical protein [Mycobacterium sp.]